MANTTTSPNMGLPVPVVSVDPGPDWATNVNASLGIIDGHNHSSGQGVAIGPSGMNINTDLPMNNNNLTTARTVRFQPQNSTIAASSPDLGCLYESGVDLYYNDGSGNQVRITSGGSVTGSTGTITGLPSGTAGASFSAGTFTFQAATSTPATMNVGPLVVGNQIASSSTVTIAPNAAIGSNYNFTLPASLPAAANYMTLDNSGNVAYNTSGSTGTGAVVLANAPTFVGTPAGTITSAAFTPTLTYTPNTAASVATNIAYYMRIGAVVHVSGTIIFTTSGTSGGTFLTTITIPIATTTLRPGGPIVSTSNASPSPTGLVQSSNTAVTAANSNYPGTSTTGQGVYVGYQYSYQIN